MPPQPGSLSISKGSAYSFTRLRLKRFSLWGGFGNQVESHSLLAFITMASGQAVAVVVPLQTAIFGQGPAAAGLLVASFFVARVVADLFAVLLGDRHPPGRLLRIGGFSLALAAIGGALAGSFAQLLVWRMVQGLGVATILLALMRVLVAKSRDLDTAQSVSSYQSWQLIGVLSGPLIGGFVADAAGLQSPYWILAVAGGIVAFGSRPLNVLREATPDLSRHTQKSPLFVRGIGTALVMEFFVFVARAGAQLTAIPLLAVGTLGLSPAQVGIALGVSGASHLLSMPLARRVSVRVPRMYSCVLAVAGMGIAVAAHAYVSSFVHLLIASVALGAMSSLGFMLPAVIVSELAPVGRESRALGLYRASGSLGSVVGPALIALLLTYQEPAATLGFCGLLLVGAAPLLILSGRVRPPTRTTPHS